MQLSLSLSRGVCVFRTCECDTSFLSLLQRQQGWGSDYNPAGFSLLRHQANRARGFSSASRFGFFDSGAAMRDGLFGSGWLIGVAEGPGLRVVEVICIFSGRVVCFCEGALVVDAE